MRVFPLISIELQRCWLNAWGVGGLHPTHCGAPLTADQPSLSNAQSQLTTISREFGNIRRRRRSQFFLSSRLKDPMVGLTPALEIA